MREALPGQVSAVADLLRQLVFVDDAAAPDVATLADAKWLTLTLERTHLAGFAYAEILARGWGKHFPEVVLRRWKEFYLRQWMRAGRMRLEIRELVGAFRAQNEALIVLKGSAFAKRFYGDSDRRAVEDIDLLVRPERVDAAARIVEVCGFTAHRRPLGGLAAFRRWTHHFDFAKDGIPLDLHHAFRVHPSFHIDYSALWTRTVDYAEAGFECLTLADSDALRMYLLSVHFEIGLGIAGLRSLVDGLCMLRRLDGVFDWDAFVAERHRDGTYRISVNVLALVLRAAACTDRLPHLARCLDAHAAALRIPASRSACLELFWAPDPMRFRTWAWALYDMPLPLHLAWWAAGVPIRYWLHHSTSFGRAFGGASRLPRQRPIV
jgi:hypothetical protein